MAIDWGAILQQALTAGTNSLGASWAEIAPSAQQSISVLVQTAQYIVDNPDNLGSTDLKLLKDNQQLALQNVLLGYKDVGILAAEQAVAAVWNAISTGVDGAIGKVI